MTKPSISIITPFFNAEEFIPDFVRALKSQTYQSWICFLVDDHSSDDSLNLAYALVGSDPRFCILRNNRRISHSGPSQARNLALTQVDTPLIAFCDIDDIWHPQKLSLQLDFHLKNSLQLSATSFVRFKTISDHLISILDLVVPPKSITFPRMIRRNLLPLSTVVISSSLLSQPFPICHHEDYALWLKLFAAHPNIKSSCLPYVLTFYRVHTSNITGFRFKMPLWVLSAYFSYSQSSIKSLIRALIWSFYQVPRLLQLLNPFSPRYLYDLQSLLDSPPWHLPQGE